MIYLLPVHHEIQFNQTKEKSEKYKTYLLDKVKGLGITCIAEESNIESLERWRIDTTPAEVIATELKLQYLACEPSDDVKKQKGILTAQQLIINAAFRSPLGRERDTYWQDRKRELEWAKCIKNRKSENVIFICGPAHISNHPSTKNNGFDTLLQREGWKIEVITEEFIAI